MMKLERRPRGRVLGGAQPTVAFVVPRLYLRPGSPFHTSRRRFDQSHLSQNPPSWVGNTQASGRRCGSERELAPGTELVSLREHQCCRGRILDRDTDGFVERDLLG